MYKQYKPIFLVKVFSDIHEFPLLQNDILTDQCLVDIVVDKQTTIQTMIVTKILSQKATKSLSDWELAYQYDKEALEAEEK